jgi:soluble lytic murein transglycosylase-like protein
MKRMMIIFGFIPMILSMALIITIAAEAFHWHDDAKNVREMSSLIQVEKEPPSVALHPSEDLALKLYRDTLLREEVISYFTELTGSREIAEVVLRYADRNNLSVTLAFALSWVESRYFPYAVNENSSSIDRGLFQLNSFSFPDLTEKQFFSIETNAKYGIGYLRSCFDQGKNEIAALAMYNAGRTRVNQGGAPRSTLDYIAKILDYQGMLEENFTGSFTSVKYFEGEGLAPTRVTYVLSPTLYVR